MELGEAVGFVAIGALFLILVGIVVILIQGWVIEALERRRQRRLAEFFAGSPWGSVEALKHDAEQAVGEHLRRKLERDGSLSGTVRQATLDGATLMLQLLLRGKLHRVLPRTAITTEAAKTDGAG